MTSNSAYTPNVITIMKTYNGSKYIVDQINSIMNQKNVHNFLYISDDGSTDDTVDKILKLQKIYKNIFLVSDHQGEGPAKGFLNLVKYIVQNISLTDYYIAYSDQDDIWYPHKLSTAVNNLKDNNADLFLSTYDVLRDGNKSIRDMGYSSPITVERILAYWCPSGNVFVFTKKFARVLSKTNPSRVRMHDFWTLLVAVTGGFKIITVDLPLLMYRLHENNTVGLDKIGFPYFKKLYTSMRNDRHIRSNQAVEILNENNLVITDEKIYFTLKKFATYRQDVTTRINISRLNIAGMSRLQKILFKISTIIGVF